MANKKNARRKKKTLNQGYKYLIEQARNNEIILKQFQEMELCLMRCESFPELACALLNDIKEKFNLELVTLHILDPDQEIQPLLDSIDSNHKQDFPNLSFALEENTIRKIFRDNGLPKLDRYDPERHAPLFLNSPLSVLSVAILLLQREERIIGCMCLGDRHPDRFKKNTATDFLQHLSAVISVCIDMAMLRSRLQTIT